MATEAREAAPPVNSSFSFIDPEEQWLRRRLPRHLPKRPNDIYVNSNSNIKGQEVRGMSLLNESGWVVVHGLGSAVPYAINLALTLQAAVRTPTTLHTNTSSVYLNDDIEPSLDGVDHNYHSKGCAAVHIKISLQQSNGKENCTTKDPNRLVKGS
ncbi:ribonuclease P protein subunit p20 [Procambarus clarkii]|uniref:ribonuclease P protein subunit p20 n=1 Tax=Procambarus clarkii TaxID=6728 RepID=UPI001E6726D5|nr:ribonuclease P protein subunit p20-like [Procambarus clarkii]XP_045602246.1 ribonuclease P protein subunit p20-like [Procambarus clarkii]